MTPSKTIARLMETILILSIVLALIGVVMMVLGGGFSDAPTDIKSLLARHRMNGPFFFGLAVLILLCTPLLTACASVIIFFKNQKKSVALLAALLFMILAVSVARMIS